MMKWQNIGIKLILFFIMGSIKAETVSVNFENPFAQSPLKRLVDTCSILWGDLELVCGKHHADGSSHNRDHHLMSALGSTTYLKERVLSVCSQITDHDRMYVLNMLDQINHVCPHTPSYYKDDDRFTLLNDSLSNVRKQVHDYLLKVDGADS